MSEIVGKSIAEDDGRGIKEVSKAKGKAKFDGVAQNYPKRVRRRLNGLQTWGILMIGSMRLIKIV